MTALASVIQFPSFVSEIDTSKKCVSIKWGGRRGGAWGCQGFCWASHSCNPSPGMRSRTGKLNVGSGASLTPRPHTLRQLASRGLAATHRCRRWWEGGGSIRNLASRFLFYLIKRQPGPRQPTRRNLWEFRNCLWNWCCLRSSSWMSGKTGWAVLRWWFQFGCRSCCRKSRFRWWGSSRSGLESAGTYQCLSCRQRGTSSRWCESWNLCPRWRSRYPRTFTFGRGGAGGRSGWVRVRAKSQLLYQRFDHSSWQQLRAIHAACGDSSAR